MRASKKLKRAKKQKCGTEIHISGAEGIYSDNERTKVIGSYIRRAISHPRGKPDKITITMEKIVQKPLLIRSLPVTTLKRGSAEETKKNVKTLLKSTGVSGAAFKNAFQVLNGSKTMRGASLILAGSGKRVEPEKEKGVRVSRLGISGKAEKSLSARLEKEGINNATVKEAIILASKVAASGQVIAEVCVSDDPDYTTGYFASGRFGYVRIPDIKLKGVNKGGRVFFIEDGSDVENIIEFLERTPVWINRTDKCLGTRSINELLDLHHI